MKNRKISRVFVVITVIALIFTFAGTAFATGNITAREYNPDGSCMYQELWGLTRSKVTEDMTAPDGRLYCSYSKAVALVNASAKCTVDRIRVKPSGTSDLRIDPNYTSNYVGPGKENLTKQVKGVQHLLWWTDYLNYNQIDGVFGTNTLNAIIRFQRDHNLTDDGIVGPNTWRALCSSKYFKYGTYIF